MPFRQIFTYLIFLLRHVYVTYTNETRHGVSPYVYGNRRIRDLPRCNRPNHTVPVYVYGNATRPLNPTFIALVSFKGINAKRNNVARTL